MENQKNPLLCQPGHPTLDRGNPVSMLKETVLLGVQCGVDKVPEVELWNCTHCGSTLGLEFPSPAFVALFEGQS